MKKIDVHGHYLPPQYVQTLRKYYREVLPDDFPTPPWTAQTHLDMMDALEIETTLLSISSPHISFGDEAENRLLARKVNEAGADLVEKYPGRFALLASLPMPDVEGSLLEIEYALRHLSVQGFAVPTNANGAYLGEDIYNALFEVFDANHSVIVLHPNKPSAVPPHVLSGFPVPFMEFFFDTTRTVFNLILHKIPERYPHVKIVIPHAGACLGVLADRVEGGLKAVGRLDLNVDKALQSFYYDLAGACVPYQLEILLRKVNIAHLLYGSDAPYTPQIGIRKFLNDLQQTTQLKDEMREQIYFDNAASLFFHR